MTGKDTKSYMSAFSFIVSFKRPFNLEDSGWQEVSGLMSELSVEEYKEGGENGFVWKLPKEAKYKNIVLKRAMESHSLDSDLMKWVKEALEDFFFNPGDMTISIVDKNIKPLRTWNVTGVYPVKMESSSLHANKNELAIETIELAYRSFKVENDT